jgi:hypothetical protein
MNLKCYDGSTKNKGWSNSTGDISSTNILQFYQKLPIQFR